MAYQQTKKTPWRNQGELKRFWVLARQYGGEDFVYDALGGKRLHEIARDQFLELMRRMKAREDRCNCEQCHGSASCKQYRAIKYFQRRLGWNDRRLTTYIKKYAKVDAIRFLTVAKARGIIAGLQKMHRREVAKNEIKGGNALC